MYKPSNIIGYIFEQGLINALWRTVSEIKKIFLSIIYFILLHTLTTKNDKMCIVPRSSIIDQDTISIITNLELRDHEAVILVKNKDKAKERIRSIENDSIHPDVKICKINTIQAVKDMANSNKVIIKDKFRPYTYLSKREDIVKIEHGIPAKGSKYEVRNEPLINREGYMITAASKIEVYEKVAVEGKKFKNMGIYGYPRHDRLINIKNDPEMCLLDNEMLDLLSERKYNILYAPTHKDLKYLTTIFPFDDYDKTSLNDFLSKNDIRIYLRPHVIEENSNILDGYIDGENIIYAGQSFTPSAIELMPHMDALITDYSSIYLDYILIDNPIIFVKDNIEEFEKLRGFAFDYETCWPGPKVSTQKEFTKCISNFIVEGDDKYSEHRSIIKNMFHNKTGETFVEEAIIEK